MDKWLNTKLNFHLKETTLFTQEFINQWLTKNFCKKPKTASTWQTQKYVTKTNRCSTTHLKWNIWSWIRTLIIVWVRRIRMRSIIPWQSKISSKYDIISLQMKMVKWLKVIQLLLIWKILTLEIVREQLSYPRIRPVHKANWAQCQLEAMVFKTSKLGNQVLHKEEKIILKFKMG